MFFSVIIVELSQVQRILFDLPRIIILFTTHLYLGRVWNTGKIQIRNKYNYKLTLKKINIIIFKIDKFIILFSYVAFPPFLLWGQSELAISWEIIKKRVGSTCQSVRMTEDN